jgi:hypothetical protein
MGINAELSDLTEATSPSGGELMYIVQGGNSRKLTLGKTGAQLLDDTGQTQARATIGLGSAAVVDTGTFLSDSIITTLGRSIIDDTGQTKMLTTLGGGAKGRAIFQDTGTTAVLTELGFSALMRNLHDDTGQTQARTTLGLGIVAPTVWNYGAAVDGVTVDNSAVTAMVAALGYVTFPPGTCKINTMTISVPIFFQDNAAITIATGQTVTIKNRINAPKQHIFKGVGAVGLDGDTSTGEDSKVCHVAWWGVFPVDGATIQTTEIQRALNAFTAETREGVMEFDNGSYRIDGAITIPRGVHLKGQGTRRTIFDLIGEGYTAFVSGGDAVFVSGIQFEQPSGLESARSGILIDLQHNGCKAWDIRLWGTDVGIKISEGYITLRDISAVYNYEAAPGAGSAVVWVAAGANNCNIDNISCAGSTYGPENIVLISNASATSVGDIRVTNVQTTEDSVGVYVKASGGGDCNRISINGVIHAGGAVDAVVKFSTANASSITSASVSGIVSNSSPLALVRIDQDSSGSCRYISIDNSAIYGSSNNGLVLDQTAGTLSEIIVGNSFNCIARTTPFVKTGTMSNVVLPTWYDGIFSGRLTLNDDTAGSITPPYNGGLMTITFEGGSVNSSSPATNRSGIVIYDVGATPNAEKGSAGGAAFAVVATDVTGTTGTDTFATVGVIAGTIRVENRSGGVGVFRYSFH